MSDTEPPTEFDARLHALNLSVALHRDRHRFEITKEGEAPPRDINTEVMDSAERFHAWLTLTGQTAEGDQQQ